MAGTLPVAGSLPVDGSLSVGGGLVARFPAPLKGRYAGTCTVSTRLATNRSRSLRAACFRNRKI